MPAIPPRSLGPPFSPASSLARAGAAERLVVALGLSAALWLAIGWALA